MANIGLQMENAQLNLVPGEAGVVRVNLTNSGNVVDAFTVTVMGLDPTWYTLSTGEVRLFPAQSAAVTLQIHPPAGGVRPLAGFYPFTIMALSRDNPTEQTLGQGMINLSAVGGLAVELQPRTVSGRKGLYAVTLSNAGNSPRTTILSLSDPEEALRFSLGTPITHEGDVLHADVFAAPTNTGYTNSPLSAMPPFGSTTRKGRGIVEQEIEIPASSSVVVPVQVKPDKAVWTGKERPFPFTVGAHPPGVEWEAAEAQTVEGRLAYRPIFAAWVGAPVALRRALILLIPLLIFACLLFLLLRPQDNSGLSTAARTQTAVALSAAQTQTALAASLAQTMTAVAQANGGNVAATNATLTALAQSSGGTQTALASAAQTALASANASATSRAQAANGQAGTANIDKFFLKLGDPNATATPIGGGIAGSETSLQYNVTGAVAVRINQQSHPFQSTSILNASVIDFRMVATGTNQLPITRTLSVLIVRPPVITNFDGSRLTVSAGDSTSLLWKVLGAKNVTIDGIPVTGTGADGNGQIGVQPTGTRRFVICATNEAGTICKSVVVTVLAPGVPTPTRAPAAPATKVPNTSVSISTKAVPTTAAPTTAVVPTTAVPTVLATTCPVDYTITEERNTALVAAGSAVAGLQCDDCAATTRLPFPFQLYDRVFDRVSVGSNGTLNFASTTNPSSTNSCLPSTAAFDFAIFPYWDNLTTVGKDTNGKDLGVFTSVSGDAPNRVFDIEWRARVVALIPTAITRPSSAATAAATPVSDYINFEVRLYENAPDQRFDVVYAKLPPLSINGKGATIGVQHDNGSHLTQYSCNTSSISEGLSLIFTLPCGSGTGTRPTSCVTGSVNVNIQDGKLSPRNIIISLGSTVAWSNLDSAPHNVVALSNTWNSGTLNKNQGFKLTFNTPGVYYYRSTLDTGITGNITVLEACTPATTPSSTRTGGGTVPNTSTATPPRGVTGTLPSSTRAVTGTPPTSVPTVTGIVPTNKSTLTVTVTGTVPTGTATGTPLLITGTTGTATKFVGSVTSTATASNPGGQQQCASVDTFTGSIQPGDSTQVGRVGLYDTPSICGVSQPYLSAPDSTPRHYDAYTLVNNIDGPVCVTVEVSAETCAGAGLMSVAYLNAFNPNDVGSNYLAQGGPPSPHYFYSFTVPARSTYVVVVHEYGPDQGCNNYTVRVNSCTATSSTPSPTETKVRPTSPPPPPGVTNVPTQRPTNTPVRATNTPQPPPATATRINTIQPSATRTNTQPPPPASATRTNTLQPSATTARTSTSTSVPTNTSTATAVDTSTSTSTTIPTNTSTAIPTNTATLIPTNTATATVAPPTATSTATVAPPTATSTPPACTPVWTIVPSPNGNNNNYLNGVAVVSANDVWAVGDYGTYTPTGSTDYRTLVEHWNGSLWSIVPSLNPGVNGDYLNGVAVVSANDVWAVGYYIDAEFPPAQTLVEHWNGSAWSIVTSLPQGFLNGVAVVSANDVWAVGYYYDGTPGGIRTLVEHWNGSLWSIVTSLNAGGVNKLNGVAVVSANDVWAVGNYSNSPSGLARTLVEHWNGSAWSIVPSLNQGLFDSYLNGVAVVSANDVWAVGDYRDISGTVEQYKTLVEHWNGSAWSIVTSPNQGQGNSYLNGVAVVSTNDVWAVGYYNTQSGGVAQTLVEHWNGSTWSIVTSSNQVSSSNVLNGVAVVSANDVWAVGDYSVGSSVQTLVEHYSCGGISVKPAMSTPVAVTGTPTSTSAPTAVSGETCQQLITDIPPKTLSTGSTMESTLDVPLGGVITGLSVSNLSITKEGLGKLNGYLVSPGGVQVDLFHWTCRNADSAGVFRWLNVAIADEGSRSISGIYCGESVKGGVYKPDSSTSSGDAILGRLNGTPAKGTWKLLLKADPRDVDSVRLDSWGLNVCVTGIALPADRAVSSAPGAPGSLDLLFAILAALLTTVGAPLAWVRMRGAMFIEE